MREVVSLQVGQAGVSAAMSLDRLRATSSVADVAYQNAVAEAFWQQILQEHNLDASTGAYTGPTEGKDVRTERLNVLFSDMGERWVPRSLCIDLEPQTIDSIRNGPLRGLMKPDNMLRGSTGAGNNFAKGCVGTSTEAYAQLIAVLQLLHRGSRAGRRNPMEGNTH